MSAQLKIGITFSAFDLLHAGHITMLEEAKRQCDYLICGLQTDPTLDRPDKNRPVQSVVERYIQLKGCKFVDARFYAAKSMAVTLNIGANGLLSV